MSHGWAFCLGEQKVNSQTLRVKRSAPLTERKHRTHISTHFVSTSADMPTSNHPKTKTIRRVSWINLHPSIVPSKPSPSPPAAPRWRCYSPKLSDSLALPRFDPLVSPPSRANSNNMLQASAVVVWEWLNEHGRWRPYSPAVSHQIEAAIRSSDPRGGSVVLGQVDSRLSPYIIDLQSMHQFRQDTGNIHKYKHRGE